MVLLLVIRHGGEGVRVRASHRRGILRRWRCIPPLRLLVRRLPTLGVGRWVAVLGRGLVLRRKLWLCVNGVEQMGGLCGWTKYS